MCMKVRSVNSSATEPGEKCSSEKAQSLDKRVIHIYIFWFLRVTKWLVFLTKGGEILGANPAWGGLITA